MALGPKWGKKWPKNGEKNWKNDPKSHFLAIFGPFFPHFGPRAFFYFLANFFPFLDFGPFSILYQAAWLVRLADKTPSFCRKVSKRKDIGRYISIPVFHTTLCPIDFWTSDFPPHQRKRDNTAVDKMLHQMSIRNLAVALGSYWSQSEVSKRGWRTEGVGARKSLPRHRFKPLFCPLFPMPP